jgi:putative flippase GtrA
VRHIAEKLWAGIGHVEVQRFLRGCIVAAFIFTVYMGAGLLLRYLLGFSELYAAFGAFLISSPVSYFGHALYTFRTRTTSYSDALRFFGLMLLTGLISWLVMNAGVKVMGIPFWMGLIIITVVVPILNYLLMRLYVFAHAFTHSNCL